MHWQVKYLEGDMPEDLEEKINIFLNNDNLILKDIRFASPEEYYACVIIYKEKSIKHPLVTDNKKVIPLRC